MKGKTTTEVASELKVAYTVVQPFADALHRRVEEALQKIRKFHMEHDLENPVYGWVDNTVWVDIEPWNLTDDGVRIPYIDIRTGKQEEGFLSYKEMDDIEKFLNEAHPGSSRVNSEARYTRMKEQLERKIESLL
jgi:hypothetical protein